MADKIIGLRLRVVGTDDLIKRIGALNSELAQTQQQAKVLQKALNDATKAGNAEEAKRLGDELAGVRARIGEIKNNSSALNRELKLQQKAFKSAADEGTDSYKSLDAQLSVLRDQFKRLSAAEREGEIGKGILESAQKLNAELVRQDEQLGIFTRNVGNYEESVVRALRRAASEDKLKQELQQVNDETEQLRAANRKLADSFDQVSKAGGDVSEITKQLVKNENQIQKNAKEARDLADALRDAKSLGDQDGGASAGRGIGRRQLGAVGRLAGGAGQVVGNLAGDLLGGAQAFQSFGAAAVPAFAVFAAGGLALKGILALEGLSKEFTQLENKVGAFGNLSGQALKQATVDVKALATTFGKENDDIIKATSALAKNLGVDFNTALAKLEQGFLTGADASGELLGALEGAAEGARLAGLSVDDLIVFSNEATQSGLLSERGLELVNEFGKNIKTNSEEARAALQSALGEEFTNNLFANVQNGSLSTKDAIQQVSIELGKQGVSAKEASKVFVDAFGAQTAAENEFILSLDDTRKGVGDYINEANRLTNVQKTQLAANKELASAQQGLATTFEEFGFSLEAVGTQIKASLLNAANSAILFFNKTFGDGVAAAREEFRQLSAAVEQQNKVVADLESTYEPLLAEYDQLTVLLPTLAQDSDEAKEAQDRLREIVKQVGEEIPAAKLGIDNYSQSLTLNAEAARGFIDTQRQQQKNLKNAQFRAAVEQYSTITAEITRLNAVLATNNRSLSGAETAAIAVINPLAALTASLADVQTTANPKDLIAANEELRKLQEELKGVEQFLAGIVTDSELRKRFNLDGVKTVAEEAVAVQSEADKKAAEVKKKADTAAAAQASKAAQERAKAAAEEAKRERERLLEEEKRTREALEGAQKETNDAISELSLRGINDQVERETEAVKLSTRRRIETETKSLQDAAAERVRVLGEIAQKNDPALRKQFGTPEQIAQQIDDINAATKKAIDKQTALLLQEQQDQIDAIVENRNKAVTEALRSIDSAEISAALTEVQQRIQSNQGEQAALQLAVDLDTSRIDSQFKQEAARLREQRAAGLITEREYQTQVSALELAAENARIKVRADAFDETERLRAEAAALQKLQLEGELQQQRQAIEATREATIDSLKTQLKEGLITQAQFNEAEAFARETAAAQTVNLEANTQQQIRQIDEETTAARQQNEQELLDSTAEYSAQRLEALREEQRAIIEATSQAIQEIGTLVLQAAQIADDFFTASENKKKAEINARYDAELQRARGNSTAISRIEARREQELAAIEKKAAERRKAIAKAQAIVNGAVAVTNILATSPDPTGISTAIRIAAAIAQTAAQIAVIDSTESFAEGGAIPKGDGMISGRSHASGGVRARVNGHAIEAEGGEWIADMNDGKGTKAVINKHNTRLFRNVLRKTQNKNFKGKGAMLSAINSYGGNGVRFASGGAIPPAVGTPQGAQMALQTGQEQIAALTANLAALQGLIQATNARIDRLTVIADADEITRLGIENIPTVRAQEISS